MKIHVKDKKPMRRSLLLCIIPMMYTALMIAQDAKPQDSTLKKFDGYIPLYWDSKNGKLLMEIKRFDTEFLYQVSLQTGVGSNPIGFDRGQLGSTNVVSFERAGNKILLNQPNYSYRARSNDPAERRAVKESFATSV